MRRLRHEVGALVNTLDADVFGQPDVFLNGIRGDVRTQETNLGSLTADANIFYAEQYLAEYGDALLPGFDGIDVSFKNGGGIRDTVTAAGLYELAEHFVSGIEIISGRFGQIGGIAFSFDPTAAARTATTAGERIQNLVLLDDDGSVREVIVQDGTLVADPTSTYSVVTLSFLANDLGTGVAGDSYPLVLDNVVSLADLAEPTALGQAELAAGGEQDALAEYLAATFDEDHGLSAFAEADTAPAEDQRIQNLAARKDTVLAGIGDFMM